MLTQEQWCQKIRNEKKNQHSFFLYTWEWAIRHGKCSGIIHRVNANLSAGVKIPDRTVPDVSLGELFHALIPHPDLSVLGWSTEAYKCEIRKPVFAFTFHQTFGKWCISAQFWAFNTKEEGIAYRHPKQFIIVSGRLISKLCPFLTILLLLGKKHINGNFYLIRINVKSWSSVSLSVAARFAVVMTTSSPSRTIMSLRRFRSGLGIWSLTSLTSMETTLLTWLNPSDTMSRKLSSVCSEPSWTYLTVERNRIYSDTILMQETKTKGCWLKCCPVKNSELHLHFSVLWQLHLNFASETRTPQTSVPQFNNSPHLFSFIHWPYVWSN